MRTLKIIHHNCVEKVSTFNVRNISSLFVQEGYEGSGRAYIEVRWITGSTVIQLPTEKTYELYDKIVSWLSNEVTDLEVELIKGMDGDAIDYIAVEK